LESEVKEQVKKFTRSVLPALCVLGLLVGVKSAYPAAGSLDPTFGNGGVTVTSFGSSSNVSPLAVKVLSGGKILVLLNPENTPSNELLRYTSTGALDRSFGKSGFAPAIGASMSILSNGQIVVGAIVTDQNTGQQALAAQRLNADGTKDTAFGKGGMAIADVDNRAPLSSLILAQPDGDILICSLLEPLGRPKTFQTALARFTADGAVDTTFGNQGVAIATGVGGCGALAVLSNGDILTVNGGAVAQYTASGSIESSVSGGTILASNGSSGFELPNLFEPNGDILLGHDVFTGELRGHDSAVQVLRFTETGESDPTFNNQPFHWIGSGGGGIEALISGLAVAPSGDILVVGNQVMFSQQGTTAINGLARLTSTGQLDPTFGKGGIVANSVPGEGLALVAIQQPNNKIITVGAEDSTDLVIGGTELVISRYLAQ
jgi:uncharacterized delta-60 repeat protein